MGGKEEADGRGEGEGQMGSKGSQAAKEIREVEIVAFLHFRAICHFNYIDYAPIHFFVQSNLSIRSSSKKKRDFIPLDCGSLVQGLPQFNAPFNEGLIFTKLQISLVGVSIMVVACQWEKFVNVAPFNEVFASL